MLFFSPRPFSSPLGSVVRAPIAGNLPQTKWVRSEVLASKPFTNKTISIHLDDSNYLLWRQQVLFAIESLALVNHVDGTLSVPPQYILEGGNRVLNSDFVAYKQQDSALCSWLLSSFGSSVLPALVNCKTKRNQLSLLSQRSGTNEFFPRYDCSKS